MFSAVQAVRPTVLRTSSLLKGHIIGQICEKNRSGSTCLYKLVWMFEAHGMLAEAVNMIRFALPSMR